jgi:hypothetical protein
MENIEATMQGIEYYQVRLEEIIRIFKDHETDLLEKNKDKIIELIEGYKSFKGNPSYTPLLPSVVENFIL